MNELKSIAEISADIGVTKQAIYNKIKQPDLQSALKLETVKQGNATYYTLNAQKLIAQAFSANIGKEHSSNFKSEFKVFKEFKEKNEKLESELKDFQKKLESKEREIETKDAEIWQKEETLKEFKVKLETLERLSTSQSEQLNHIKSELNLVKNENYRQSIDLNSKEELNVQLKREVETLTADKKKLNERLDKAEENISNLTSALQAAQALHGIDKHQAVIDMTENVQQEQAPVKTKRFFSRLFKKQQ